MAMTVEELIEKLQQQPYRHLPVVVSWQESMRFDGAHGRRWEMTHHPIQTVELDGGRVLITLTDK